MKLNHTERAFFLINDNLCDREKYMPIFTWVFLGQFMGVFGLFHGCFKDTSRFFPECFNVILGYVSDLQIN